MLREVGQRRRRAAPLEIRRGRIETKLGLAQLARDERLYEIGSGTTGGDGGAGISAASASWSPEVMTQELASLLTLLGLEKIEEDLFRGQSQDPGWGAVFGGQVLGQALSAAVQTVPRERAVHSLHAYFLRPGDVSKPILYEVDRIRDGGSFNTRRVVAIQSGAAIFNMAASFHKAEPGFEHQDAMPDVPPPEQVPTDQERLLRAADRIPRAVVERFSGQRAFEARSVDALDDLFHPSRLPPNRAVWLKTTAPVPEDSALHVSLLAYISDHAFLGTALFPHGVTFFSGEVQVASLDHVMWFHAPFRVDDWLLHVIDSPVARGARGLVRGRVFTRDGRLVASTARGDDSTANEGREVAAHAATQRGRGTSCGGASALDLEARQRAPSPRESARGTLFSAAASRRGGTASASSSRRGTPSSRRRPRPTAR